MTKVFKRFNTSVLTRYIIVELRTNRMLQPYRMQLLLTQSKARSRYACSAYM